MQVNPEDEILPPPATPLEENDTSGHCYGSIFNFADGTGTVCTPFEVYAFPSTPPLLFPYFFFIPKHQCARFTHHGICLCVSFLGIYNLTVEDAWKNLLKPRLPEVRVVVKMETIIRDCILFRILLCLAHLVK